MQYLSSPAIVLRVIEYGDNDKILTLFTLNRGKTSLIAKGAQKSVKRFAGLLELFSALDIVWNRNRPRGLPLLQEVSVIHPFDRIRTNINHTAYASCWCELVCQWMEQDQQQSAVYELLVHFLERLNTGVLSGEILHVAFQLHFMAMNGLKPGFECCVKCRLPVDAIESSVITFNVRLGGILCHRCSPCKPGHICLSRGTVKLLHWVLTAPPERLNRVRFSRQAMEESLQVLEAFLPYHLGKETRSAKFLKRLRTG